MQRSAYSHLLMALVVALAIGVPARPTPAEPIESFYRGKIIIKANDHATKGRWTAIPSGSGIHRDDNQEVFASTLAEDRGALFQMPKLASSWEELESLLGTEGKTAVGAIA